MNQNLLREITRWAVLGVGCLLLALAMSMTTRNVYSRTHIDARMAAIQGAHAEDMRRIERELDYMHQDIQWLVRKMGGTPSADAESE